MPQAPDNLISRFRSFDCETHLIQPGLLAPPLVCASIAWWDGAAVAGELLTKERALQAFREYLAPPYILVGANIAYDCLVMAVHAARLGIDIMPEIFRAYRECRVFDIQIAQQLDGIAKGLLGLDHTGSPLRSPSTGKPSHYSQEVVDWLVHGRSDAKAHDKWRLRYAELEFLPFSSWEPEARQYPVDDAVIALENALAQSGLIPRGRGGETHPNENIHDMPAQVFTAWALHLGAAWGFNVDPQAIEALEKKTADVRAKGVPKFTAAGLFKLDKDGRPVCSEKTGAESKNQSLIKRMIAEAYGCTAYCTQCKGERRVPSLVKCTACKGEGTFGPMETCGPCAGVGRIPHKKNTRGCPSCDSTGYDFAGVPLPLTDTGRVSIGRDTLVESGVELLMDFAAFSEYDKIKSTYLPILRKGLDDNARAIPMNLRPRVLVATGRTSYGGGIQTLPTRGGVRECFVARPGYVFCSSDYGGVELVSHAQSCLNILGWSKLAEAINAGVGVHDALGATIAGLPVDDFLIAKRADDFLKSCRQAAKPLNFGFPGGMGAPTLVLTQRKSGPDTTAPDGTKYKGLRFCLLVGKRERCGETMVTEWKKKPLPPTCLHCLECADTLRDQWFAQWPENRPYFAHVAQLVDQVGHLIQHVSKRKRGGLTFCSAANSYFQGLAADGFKSATCQVAFEQHVDTASPLFGSRTILSQHDELIVEMLEERAHDAAARLRVVMVENMQKYTPDVLVDAEPCLMRRWHKGAEPVYNDSGTLIPWEPTT